ncbi:unnamed protein product [Parascedosporium putredinis]|uniref:Uncharacterized protein n=1 Tax=Parascedosporium putredinis TaxID=1442378 RepID=A0A9P1H0J3_9PEZI|nr:unnamed protein product [Parascedosporium putredinis]CAI7992871.1 unnamed protein product [Parascedosporium putredinis]
MHPFSLLLAFVATATALNPTRSSATLSKRALKTCQESHGEGFEQCGPAESGYCFNPAEGQSENLEACSTNAGFQAPASAASASASGSDDDFSANTFDHEHHNGGGRKHERVRNGTTTATTTGLATATSAAATTTARFASGTGGIVVVPLPTGSLAPGNFTGNRSTTPVIVSQGPSAQGGGVLFSLAIALVVAVFAT